MLRGFADQLSVLAPGEVRRFEFNAGPVLTAGRYRVDASLDDLAFSILGEVKPADGAPAACLDLGFEAVLGRLCGSELLRRLQVMVHEVWLQAEIAVGVTPGRPDRLHQEHRQVLAALERGDLEETLRRLREHLAFRGAGGADA